MVFNKLTSAAKKRRCNLDSYGWPQINEHSQPQANLLWKVISNLSCSMTVLGFSRSMKDYDNTIFSTKIKASHRYLSY